LDLYQARTLPALAPPVRAVESPELPVPRRLQVVSGLVPRSGQAGDDDPELAAGRGEARDVADVPVVRAEVVGGGQADDGVEEAGREREPVGLGVDGEDAVAGAGLRDAAPVVGGLDPEVGRPHLAAELAGEEDRAQRPAAAQVEDPHARAELEDLAQ